MRFNAWRRAASSVYLIEIELIAPLAYRALAPYTTVGRIAATTPTRPTMHAHFYGRAQFILRQWRLAGIGIPLVSAACWLGSKRGRQCPLLNSPIPVLACLQRLHNVQNNVPGRGAAPLRTRPALPSLSSMQRSNCMRRIPVRQSSWLDKVKGYRFHPIDERMPRP